MKKIILGTAISALAFSAFAADLKTDDQKISYVIGSQMANTLKNNVSGPIELDKAVLFEAMTDVLDGKELQLQPKDEAEVMQVFAKKAGEYAKKQAAEAVEKNKAEAKKLLEENKAKDGVKVTESGLQYRVITEGEGAKPAATDTVKVHYKGTLADGSTFDSSYDRGEPVEFPLNAVIPGWTEGLQLMPVGSKYEFVIPAELAYGARGPAQIGPERALIFEVELLDVKSAEKKAEKPAKVEAAEKTEKPAEKTEEKK